MDPPPKPKYGAEEEKRIKQLQVSDLKKVNWEGGSMHPKAKFIKILVVGDGAAVMDNTCGIVEGTNGMVALSVWDTGGREDSERLRPLSYPQTNCFLVCFSVVSHTTSFENAITRHAKDVMHHLSNVPVILVGLKSDLRNNTEVQAKLAQNNMKYVSKEEALEAAKEYGFYCYLECSAKENVGLEGLFETAFKLAIQPTVKKTNKCIIM